MYYIKTGIKMPWLAKFFAVFGMLATFGAGNMTQSNAVAVLEQTFGINKLFVGCVLAIILAGIVIIGGIKNRYCNRKTCSIYGCILYYRSYHNYWKKYCSSSRSICFDIFKCIQHTSSSRRICRSYCKNDDDEMGISRGYSPTKPVLEQHQLHMLPQLPILFVKECRGIFEVLMDTLVICTMTALVIIVTSQWNSGLQGAVLTTTAFETGFKGGGFIVALGLTFFAFSTILG